MTGAHQTKKVRVRIAPDLSCTGKWRWVDKPIDIEIADLVEALQKAKVWTRFSCSGHGEGYGVITLQDGRRLHVLFPDASRDWRNGQWRWVPNEEAQP